MQNFTISLQVHHVSRDLHFLTETLATEPVFCMTAGEIMNHQPRRTSVWHAPLFQGANQQHFDQALGALLGFLKENDATLAEFAEEDGLLEMIFTFSVAAAAAKAGDVAHSVNLHPFLLFELSSRQIGVKVQTTYRDQD